MLCYDCKVEMKKIKINYQYTESGLNNVVLKGIRAYKCPKCKEINPIIPRIKEIHRMIGKDLINKNSLLMGDEVTFLRKEMGIRAKDLAQILGVTGVTVSRWENEKEPISPACDRLIRVFYVKRLFEQACQPVKPEIDKVESQLLKVILTSICKPEILIEDVFRNIRRRHIRSEISIPSTMITSSKPIHENIFPIPNLNPWGFK